MILLSQTILFGTTKLEFKKLITQCEHTACRIARFDEVAIEKKVGKHVQEDLGKKVKASLIKRKCT